MPVTIWPQHTAPNTPVGEHLGVTPRQVRLGDQQRGDPVGGAPQLQGDLRGVAWHINALIHHCLNARPHVRESRAGQAWPGLGLGQIGPESANDQQRVVDGQRQPHRDGEVEREDRHFGEEGDRAQHRHRPQGRETTDGQMQGGRQQAAEHPHQHDEAQRNGDRFHEQQVAFALAADLRVDHGLTAILHRHPGPVMNKFSRERLGVLLRVVLTAGDARDDQPRLAVLAERHRRGRRRRRVRASVDRVLWGRTTWSSHISLSPFGTAIVVAILTWIVLNVTIPSTSDAAPQFRRNLASAQPYPPVGIANVFRNVTQDPLNGDQYAQGHVDR